MSIAQLIRRGTPLVLVLTGLALVAVACSDASSGSSIGGSVMLERTIDGPPFYDPIIEQALIDSRQLSSSPLATFEPPASATDVVAGSVVPKGQFGELKVGRWNAVDDTLGSVACLGFIIAEGNSGSECTQEEAPPASSVYFHVECTSDEPPRWYVFSVDDGIDALRLDLEGDVTVIGDDPMETGLVAVEAIGQVTSTTAQTTDGRVWATDISVTCP